MTRESMEIAALVDRYDSDIRARLVDAMRRITAAHESALDGPPRWRRYKRQSNYWRQKLPDNVIPFPARR